MSKSAKILFNGIKHMKTTFSQPIYTFSQPIYTHFNLQWLCFTWKKYSSRKASQGSAALRILTIFKIQTFIVRCFVTDRKKETLSENFENAEIKFPVLGGGGRFLLSKEFSSGECNRVFRFETFVQNNIGIRQQTLDIGIREQESQNLLVSQKLSAEECEL